MSRKPKIWINVAALLLAGAWQCGALASAASGEGVDQLTVRFNDLNLEQSKGVAALCRRLRNAAEHVCGEPERPGSGFTSPDWRACVAQAVERAVVAVDRPALTAYYREHNTFDHETLTARR